MASYSQIPNINNIPDGPPDIEIDASEDLKRDFLKLSPQLTVTVYDADGNLKSSMKKEDDLILNNFRDFFVELFTDNGGGTITASLTNDANTAKTVNVKGTTYLNSWQDSSSGTAAKGAFAGIGNGTTAAARTDYALESQIETYATEHTTPVYTAATGLLSLSYSFTITGTRNVSEAVLGCAWLASDASENKFVMFRDVFANISVVNTDIVIVGYVINLTDTGFTNKFGDVLSAIFKSVADAGTTTHYLTDIAGTILPIFTYTSSDANEPVFNHNPKATIIQIGTSSTATARTHYMVQVPVETGLDPNVHTVGTGTIIIGGDIVCASARTITEAGLYLGVDNSEGAQKQFMVWRKIFVGVSVGAGQSIRITFTVTL